MSFSNRPKFFRNQIVLLSVLYEVTGMEIGKLVELFAPLPRRNLLKTILTLRKQGLVDTYRARGTKKWVVHLTARGFELAGFAFPLKKLDFDRNVYFLLRPETASKETGISVQTIRRKKSLLFTYVTVGHRLYVVKSERVSVNRERFLLYPFVNEADLPRLMENPPLRSPVVREAIRNARSDFHGFGRDDDLLFYPLFLTGILKNPDVEIRHPTGVDIEFYSQSFKGGGSWEDFLSKSFTGTSRN